MAARNLKGVAVSDDDVRQAVAYAWRHFKIVVEPGGAVALAAILSGKTDCRGKTVVATLSGGNVDAATYRDCLESA
jgi:threonine dehydratase